MTKVDFIRWLESNTNLSPYSIKRYANAIDTLSTELKHYGLFGNNLYNIADKEAIENILNNSEFKEKNKRGNRMYSAALNHFRNFVDYCNRM